VNAAAAQIVDQIADEDGVQTGLGDALEHVDNFFTVIFTAELAVNAYAHWFWSFVRDGWNLFDSIVVALSLVALGPIAMPINALRSLRAFRVVRLFGRMSALRNIIAALTAAIVPVLNAFLVMLIVSSICEILTLPPALPRPTHYKLPRGLFP
jgi:voltage-gated sodium channel